MRFRIWRDGEQRERAGWLEAETHQDAAERWASLDDSTTNDYTIVNGEPAIVSVAPVGSYDVRRFRVSGEAIRVYRAVEIEK